jgi:predicted peptidase
MSAFGHGSVEVSNDGVANRFRYRLLRPAVVEPGRVYPVVLFLHGAGERGTENEKQRKYLPQWLAEPGMQEKYPCYLVAPQCRPDHLWVEVAWDDVASTPQSPEMTPDLAAAVAALDDVLATEAADPQRVYLTGLSMGGYGAWDLAARMPKRFAALLPICGGGDETTVPRLANLPIWCFHGTDDTVVLPGRSRRMIAAVKAAGGSPRYSELEGVGHDSWTPAYRDPAVLDWLFAQRKEMAR